MSRAPNASGACLSLCRAAPLKSRKSSHNLVWIKETFIGVFSDVKDEKAKLFPLCERNVTYIKPLAVVYSRSIPVLQSIYGTDTCT